MICHFTFLAALVDIPSAMNTKEKWTREEQSVGTKRRAILLGLSYFYAYIGIKILIHIKYLLESRFKKSFRERVLGNC